MIPPCANASRLCRRAIRAIPIVVVVAASVALVGFRIRVPLQIRIEGFVEAAPAGVSPSRTVSVQLARGEQRRLAVTQVVNLGSGPLGATILSEVGRRTPSFFLVGDRSLLERLETAPSGAPVTIGGNLSADRRLLVSSLQVEPVPKSSPHE